MANGAVVCIWRVCTMLLHRTNHFVALTPNSGTLAYSFTCLIRPGQSWEHQYYSDNLGTVAPSVNVESLFSGSVIDLSQLCRQHPWVQRCGPWKAANASAAISKRCGWWNGWNAHWNSHAFAVPLFGIIGNVYSHVLLSRRCDIFSLKIVEGELTERLSEDWTPSLQYLRYLHSAICQSVNETVSPACLAILAIRWPIRRAVNVVENKWRVRKVPSVFMKLMYCSDAGLFSIDYIDLIVFDGKFYLRELDAANTEQWRFEWLSAEMHFSLQKVDSIEVGDSESQLTEEWYCFELLSRATACTVCRPEFCTVDDSQPKKQIIHTANPSLQLVTRVHLSNLWKVLCRLPSTFRVCVQSLANTILWRKGQDPCRGCSC